MAATRKVVLFLDGSDRGRAAAAALEAVVGRFKLPWAASTADPAAVTAADLDAAAVLVALDPAVRDRFPGRAIEVWVDPEAIDREVNGLVARLLGGTRTSPPMTAAKPAKPAKPAQTAKVGRETKGRRGKGVTTVSGLTLSEAALNDLAAKLKTACGTGGTVRGGVIEIQGDLRDRVAAELEKHGYATKRVGG